MGRFNCSVAVCQAAGKARIVPDQRSILLSMCGQALLGFFEQLFRISGARTHDIQIGVKSGGFGIPLFVHLLDRRRELVALGRCRSRCGLRLFELGAARIALSLRCGYRRFHLIKTSTLLIALDLHRGYRRFHLIQTSTILVALGFRRGGCCRSRLLKLGTVPVALGFGRSHGGFHLRQIGTAFIDGSFAFGEALGKARVLIRDQIERRLQRPVLIVPQNNILPRRAELAVQFGNLLLCRQAQRRQRVDACDKGPPRRLLFELRTIRGGRSPAIIGKIDLADLQVAFGFRSKSLVAQRPQCRPPSRLLRHSQRRHPEGRVGKGEMFGLRIPTVPLHCLAGESHLWRVALSLDAGSVASLWLMDG